MLTMAVCQAQGLLDAVEYKRFMSQLNSIGEAVDAAIDKSEATVAELFERSVPVLLGSVSVILPAKSEWGGA